MAYQGGRKFLVASHWATASWCQEEKCWHHPQGQAGAQSEGAREAAALSGRWRTGASDRREPQDGDFRLDQVPEMGADAACGCSDTRRRGSPTSPPQGRRGLELGRRRRAQLHFADEGIGRLARQPRSRRPHRAEGFSQEQQVRRPAPATAKRRRIRLPSRPSDPQIKQTPAHPGPPPAPRPARRDRRPPISIRLATNSSESSDLSKSAAAVSPKNSFSPGRRPAPKD